MVNVQPRFNRALHYFCIYDIMQAGIILVLWGIRIHIVPFYKEIILSCNTRMWGVSHCCYWLWS